MRNPALQLVGITASPEGGGGGGGGEEELSRWLETRMHSLGLDPVAYSRFVLGLLGQRSDSTPPLANNRVIKSSSSSKKLPAVSYGEKDQQKAIIQCLTNAADKNCGVEPLVDELCAKLRVLTGADVKDTAHTLDDDGQSKTASDVEQKYYAAFPALGQLGSSISNSYWEENNNVSFINNNNNKNSKKSKLLNSKINNRSGQKKTKLDYNINPQIIGGKGFEFAKTMERERERQKAEERELDQLKLAQLQAKFDESLEALWDSSSGTSQSTDSIWAAPSLSIPSRPLWPADTTETSYPMILLDRADKVETPSDESPQILWDIDLFSIEDCVDEVDEKDKAKCKVTDSPWFWGKLNKLVSSDNCQESYFQQKVAIEVPEPDEDLLTSTRTHFRPIKDDGHWADGTTFPINNNLDKISYQRSESGSLLYVPGSKSPYMEYREKSFSSPRLESSKLTLKFRIQQCDKGIQTEPCLSPVKRRILTEQDRFYCNDNDNGGIGVGTQVIEDLENDSFPMNYLGWNNQTILHLHNERKRYV